MVFLYILLGLVIATLVYLVVIIFFPVLQVELQPTKKEVPLKVVPNCREDIEFEVEGLKIKGWFYSPNNKKSPCIVMNHGFCGTKDFILEDFALRFIEEGYRVLTYDFRYFGESEGLPRQWHCGKFQYEDQKAAVAYARTREDVFEDKVIIWGTSGGAPYGVSLAGEDPTLAAVIAQVGSYNHKEDNQLFIDEVGWWHFLRLIPHAQRDKGRARFGLSEHIYSPYGRPNTFSFINLPGAFNGIEELAKESNTFKNEICARVAFMPHAPDPMNTVSKIKCPILFVVATEDNLVSQTSHKALLDDLGQKGKEVLLPYNHWQVYKDEAFEENIREQIEFLKQI